MGEIPIMLGLVGFAFGCISSALIGRLWPAVVTGTMLAANVAIRLMPDVFIELLR